MYSTSNLSLDTVVPIQVNKGKYQKHAAGLGNNISKIHQDIAFSNGYTPNKDITLDTTAAPSRARNDNLPTP